MLCDTQGPHCSRCDAMLCYAAEALISRFDVRVAFPPPDKDGRALVFQRYAKHLPQEALASLAAAADGLSGRDILDACKHRVVLLWHSCAREAFAAARARVDHGAAAAISRAGP